MPEEQRPTALITGASAGIGRELAHVFAENGFDLVIVARSRDALQALADSLRAAHDVVVMTLPCDLREPHAPRALFQTVREQGLHIDVLVNNAGVSFHGDFPDIALEDHLALLQLNIVALTALTYLFLQPMLQRGEGRILNVASLSAFQPVPTLAVYAASKSFVLSLTESLAMELAETGVTVTALCPGFTETAMLQIASATTGAPTPLPSFVVGDAAQVARDGYRACMDGETVCISGRINQLASLWMQYQPRWLGRLMGRLAVRQLR